ncbi:MAG: membrane dipeptidase [Oscillospiraceae bacterium]|jgi:membrane dipeptidase|nr:membrane dipeptidase [Oscillospiraceae bacterium]
MRLPYFDAHCDTLSRCLHTGESLLKNSGQCDLERLGAYQPAGQIFAIFADSADIPPEERFGECRRQAELFAGSRERWPERMKGAVLSIEGAELLDCDPGRLETVRAWGVRCVNLTWNHANALSGSHREEPERGLSDKGIAFARRAWELGILPDVSHLSDAGFWDLVRAARGPILASHSNSRAVCGHTRNLTDDQFLAVRDSGGVVGINLFTAFVGGDGSMDALLAHFEHFLELGGEKTLALGSDWDGDITGAGGIRGAEDMCRLAEAMERKNYGEDLIRAIFYGNLARLLQI